MATQEIQIGRVYVGTYAKYNNGNLAGEWLDISDFTDKEDFYEKCAAIHSDENDPEFMFQDYETDFGDTINESGIDDELFDLAGYDDHDLLMIFAVVELGNDLSYAIDNYEDCQVIECDYEHEAPSVFEDWYLEVIGIGNNHPLIPYIDSERLWNGLGSLGFTFIEGVGLVSMD